MQVTKSTVYRMPTLATKYVLEFNFHTDSQDVDVVRSRVSPNSVRRRLEQARNFLKDTYNAIVEE